MYNEFDMILKGSESDDDTTLNEWFEYEIINAATELEKFEQNDWDKLLEELPKISIHWKRWLSECLEDNIGNNQLKVLIELAKDDDVNLLCNVFSQMCDYELSDFDNKDIEWIIPKIKKYYSQVPAPFQENFDFFLNKESKVR